MSPDEHKRALYVFTRSTDGQGLHLVARQQVEALSRADWSVDLIARSPVDAPRVRWISGLARPAAALRRLDSRTKQDLRARLFGWRGARELRRHPYDAVVTWNGLGWRIIPEAERRGVPSFLNCGNFPRSPWEPGSTEERPRWPRISKRAVRSEIFATSAQVLVASDYALSRFVAAGCPPERLSNIGRGFDPDVFFPDRAPSERPFRVLFCGRLTKRKGITALLELWRELDLEGAELWLCGPVPAENRARIESLASPSVRILGFRKDVAAVMRQCDVQVLLSSHEGMAKALVRGSGLRPRHDRHTGDRLSVSPRRAGLSRLPAGPRSRAGDTAWAPR